ncbi:MAG TPA: thioredoxin family protein [Candidatus Nitrosocosmicus sp.]|jgi:peroxiredoxin|nr:thioredoxin family protein [Candidatus Nitrosocosmicus sp.]
MVKTQSSQKLISGSQAPDFSLKGVDNKNYSLKDIKSRTLLIVFICNHCPYVKARINDLISLQSKFDSSDLQVIGINSNDSSYEGEGFDNMVKFAQEYSLNFPYLIDDTQNVAKDYGAVCTPDPFLFDESKKLAFHGKINDALEPTSNATVNIMENNIQKILEGKKSSIEKDFDPSIGCSIKWSS